ncbi:hypothetical protein GWK47_005024 [Chionoecetes opilio]|uniref:Uncharacterized protein n=1 Tax=Chionoecetes opilio TaxID=41210 RepID=A0A8J4YJL8_CHIOP|nr:hypothetical protein GWK47_005024 [Chionoecetes opilio]
MVVPKSRSMSTNCGETASRREDRETAGNPEIPGGGPALGRKTPPVPLGDTGDPSPLLLTGEDDAEFLLGVPGEPDSTGRKTGVQWFEGGGRSGASGTRSSPFCFEPRLRNTGMVQGFLIRNEQELHETCFGWPAAIIPRGDPQGCLRSQPRSSSGPTLESLNDSLIDGPSWILAERGRGKTEDL